MLGILVTGPNASGKTTVVKSVAETFSGDERVLCVHGDGSPFNSGGPTETESEVSKVWLCDASVVIGEGIDRFARAVAAVAGRYPSRRLAVAITLQDPDVMRAHLMDRCAKRNKTFNAPYWDHRRLVGEGRRRYQSLGRRLFPGASFWTIGRNYEEQPALVDHLQRLVRECL